MSVRQLDTKQLKTITILYVEDEEIIREQTNRLLDKLFKKVYIAIDGENGLAMFNANQNEIDIIVSDVNMPNMNGLDMIAKINESSKRSIPTIITTAQTESKIVLDAIENKIDKFITKPVQLKELTVSIVDLVLQYRKLENLEKLAKGLVSKSGLDDKKTQELTTKVSELTRENEFNKIIIDNFVPSLKTDK